MKKIVTLLLAAALAPASMSAESKTVPYASALGGDTDWTVVNVNNDTKTWIEASGSDYSGTGYTSGIKYIYNGSMAADDWYISPAITLTAGVEYKVKFWHRVYSTTNAESYKLMMSRGATPDELAAGTEISKFEEYTNKTWSHEIQIITVDETGDYHFGFYTYSPANRWNIYITGFEVCENKFAPAAVSDLTCTPGANRALTATLAWTLPTTDNDGVSLPDGATYDKIIIKRDGSEVATLTNAETEWTDTEATGLTSGIHTYEVGVVVNGAASAFTKVDSKYIGPVEAMTLPYDANIKVLTQDDFDLFWTPVKGRNSTSTYNWMLKTTYSGNNIQYSPGSGKVQDDWIISPQMKFTEAGVYKLSVNMSYTDYYKTDFDILLGSGTEIGGYETVIKNFTALPTKDTDFEIFFTVETPGEYSIAFHVNTDIASYYTYYLKKFVVEKWQLTPAHVTDLAVTVNDDATVTLAWTNPSTSNTGTELSDLTKVELYCDGTLIETFANATPGAPMTYSHTPATPGVHEYYVLPYSSEGPADGEATKVKSGWVGDETQTLPYSTTFTASDATTPIWSGLNANNDGSEWVISTSGATLAVDKSEPDYYYRNDDYLLSPYFDFTPGYYSLKFTIKGASKNVALQIGTVSDKKDVKNSFTGIGSITLPGQNYSSNYEVIAHIETEGKYAIAVFNNNSTGPDDYNLVISKFSAAYQPVLPSIATDVTVTPAPDLSHAATISWTNPSTTNVDGVAPEIVKAVITRNGETIGEVTEGLTPGMTSSFEDTTVPNAGEYVYTVTIHGPEGPSATKPTEVKSPWIGAGLDLPFDCADGFSDMGWTVYNVNNDTNTWGDPITWNIGSSSIYITSNNNVPDDWAITPRLNFVAGTKYILTITSAYESGYSAVNWDIHFGTSVEPESMTTKIATVNTAQPSATRQTDVFHLEALAAEDAALLTSEEAGEQSETTNYINIPAGVGAIGLHANQKGAFKIYTFSIKAEEGTAIDEVEQARGYAVVGSEVFFSANADVTVYDLAGKTMLTASDVASISLAPLAKGVYIITATVNNETITLKIVK